MHIGLSIVKLIVGLCILVLIGRFIDPFQDPGTGVIIGSIGLLFVIWGGAYFAFYYAGLQRSDKKTALISSYAYKASLLMALYCLANIILLVIEQWSYVNATIVLIIFASLYWFLFYRPMPESQMTMDMIVQESKKNE